MARTTIIPRQTCPHCQHNLSGTAAPFEPTKAAQPGDICICIFCGKVLRLRDDMHVRKLTAQEAVALVRNERLMGQISQVARQMILEQAELN